MAGERTLRGNRFESYYSINRKYADIVDRKRKGILMMLTWNELDSLRTRMQGIRDEYQDKPGKLTPFNVSYPHTNGKLVGLNYEDAVELGDLAERLTAILINIS